MAKYKSAVPQPAPDLVPVEWLGKTETLTVLRGKVVLLMFWGVRCGPCLRALPDLQKLHERYQDQGLKVIAIHSQSPEHRNDRAYIQQQEHTFSVFLGTGKELYAKYLVRGLPSLYLIDREGRPVRGPERSVPSAEQIESLLGLSPDRGVRQAWDYSVPPVPGSQPGKVRE